MDIEHTPHAQAADAEFNDALESTVKDGPEVARQDRRQMRIQEYEDRSLEHPDPLVASVGALNADLLVMAQLMGTGINRALAEQGASVETIRDLAPVFSTFQNTTRQIGRNAEFELRAAEAHQELEKLKGTLKMMGSGGFAPAPPRHIASDRISRHRTR